MPQEPQENGTQLLYSAKDLLEARASGIAEARSIMTHSMSFQSAWVAMEKVIQKLRSVAAK